MVTTNLNINELIIKCRENHRRSQKCLFFLLREFVFRICYRYTAINDDPVAIMNKAFIKLSKTIGQFNVNQELDVLLALKSGLNTF